jgi:transcription initiation factor TFIIIB Brf1 subunit/transcription initiation factor TFIIB
MTDLESDDIDILENINDENLWSLFDKYVDNVQETTIDKTKCIECKSSNLIMDSNKSNYTCTDCGAENGEIFEQKPEWTTFEDGKDTGRCGIATNMFLPKSSQGTVISGSGFSKLRMIQNWNQMPYKERSLSEVLQNIEKNMKTYKITKAIIDNAKILYKNISEIKHSDGLNKGKTIIIRGLNRCGLIAACAYYGAKLQNSPRSTKEIADIFGLKLRQVTKGCRKFLELINYQSLTYNLHSSHAHDFIERFGYKLKLKKNHIDIAKKIAENINKLDIASDHQPTSMAAGSILLVSHIYNLNILKKDISDIFNISEVTIIKAFKKIFPYEKVLRDTNLTNIMLNKIQQKMKLNLDKTKIDSENNKILSDSPPISELNFDNSDIKSNLNKIFIMPDDYNADDLINGTTTLSSILTNSDTPNITSSKINIIINNDQSIKRKRGRPRKIVSENVKID